MSYFDAQYQRVRKFVSQDLLPSDIKWSRNLIRKIGRQLNTQLPPQFPREVNFRPFVKKSMFASELYVDELGAYKAAFAGKNTVITFLCVSSSNPLAVLASTRPFDYGLLKQGNGGTQGIYRYWYGADGTQIDNITEWGLDQFRTHYDKTSSRTRPITGDAIFQYVYGVLHDPVYREQYVEELKREFPRIPLLADFWWWTERGHELMNLHVDYESVEPWPLQRKDTRGEKGRNSRTFSAALLKADIGAGLIRVDTETQLTAIPPEAWTYRLGNRSALEWVLDQYKDKTPKDQTVGERFNKYRFAEHKDSVIELLKRVTRVSVDTMRIVNEMRAVKREAR